MFWQKLFFATAGVAIALTPILECSAQAADLNFSKMYVFGDSLSDTGNVFNGSGGTFPPSPYFNGRFSNGPIWVDYLADDLGLTLTTFITPQAAPISLAEIPTESVNFAFGGATTGVDNTLNSTLPGLQQQVQTFTGSLLATNRSADPNALYILWAGANDYLPTMSSVIPATTPDQPISNLSFALNSLIQSGAKTIAVANLPALGALPLTNGTQGSEPLNLLTQAHDAALAQTLESLSQSSDAKIISLDFAASVENVIQNPGTFGFTNVTSSCLFTGCLNPDEFLFWDNIHPTTKGHEILADQAYSTLNATVPEPTAGSALLVFGASGLAVSVLKRKRLVKL